MNRRVYTACVFSLAALAVNSALLWAFPTATAFNVANLLLHVGLGAVLGIAALVFARADMRLELDLSGAAITGVVLAIVGNTRDHRVILLVHVGSRCARSRYGLHDAAVSGSEIGGVRCSCGLVAGVELSLTGSASGRLIS